MREEAPRRPIIEEKKEEDKAYFIYLFLFFFYTENLYRRKFAIRLPLVPKKSIWGL